VYITLWVSYEKNDRHNILNMLTDTVKTYT